MLAFALQQFDNMNLNFLQRLCIFLVITIPTLQANWQASGNMSESNLTEIYSLIKSNQVLDASGNQQIDAIAQTISLRLNDIWAPAWNVAIFKNAMNQDAVLYGYAFKNHWIWINGVKISSETAFPVTYIIWKDYNCHTWTTSSAALSAGTTFTAEQTTDIKGYSFSGIRTNVWNNAFLFMEYLNSKTSLMGGAYSVIMNQYPNFVIQGYFCIFNRNFYVGSLLENNLGMQGSYFLFQTR